MGKFVVTGLHSSGKSAFIRSFADDEDASILEVISQLQRSTRFIAEYRFKKDTDLHIEVTLKSKEDVADEVLENIRRKIFREEENQDGNVAGDSEKKENEDGENDRLREIIQKDSQNEQLDWIKLWKWICKKGGSAFLMLEEFIPFSFNDLDNEINDIANGTFEREIKATDISFSDIKKLIENIYKESLKSINGLKEKKIELVKNSPLIWEKNPDSQSSDTLKENVKMLFCVPKSIRGDKIPYFSGIVKEAVVELSLNEKFFDESGSVKYDFMHGIEDPVAFSLIDSYGLDHGAGKSAGNDLQGIILNSYRQIISKSNIDGVFLLGTLSNDILDSQDDDQENIIPHIVNYNLSENPGLNVILIFNHADSADDYSSKDVRKEIISDLNSSYNDSIKNHVEIRKLKARFQTDYIDHSINSFLDSICLYAAVIDGNQNAEEIRAMNTETYEKIDRICRSFKRFGVSWDDKINKEVLQEIEDFIGCVYDYLSSSIKLIVAKKKMSALKDDSDYKEIGRRYSWSIRWNTAEALANCWKNKEYRYYSYMGRALSISNYPDELQKNFDIDQHPMTVFQKHMMALCNFWWNDKRFYPLKKDPIMGEYNGNHCIFIQKCMYDTIEAFSNDGLEDFVSVNISKLLGENIDRSSIEGLNFDPVQNVDNFDNRFENKFKEIFKGKVIQNYNSFHLNAIDDEIRERLLIILENSGILENSRDKYENANIRQLLNVIIQDVEPKFFIKSDFPEILKRRLMELI